MIFVRAALWPSPAEIQIIPAINRISATFDKVVCTQDWHPPGHVSFASTHNLKPYDILKIGDLKQVLWPDHCVQGTFGAEFHRDLDTRPVDLIIRKGTSPHIDSYSTFLDNDKRTKTGLDAYLLGLDIRHAFICGLATDYCVFLQRTGCRFSGPESNGHPRCLPWCRCTAGQYRQGAC